MGLKSFFKKIGKSLKKLVIGVAAVAAAIFIPGAGAFIGKALLGAAISIGASKLLAKRSEGAATSGGDGGGRVQLPPATDNKLPVVYGQAWLGGPIIDAKISVDQKYMWYCIALCEKPDSQTISFDTTDGVYYGGKKVTFGTNGAVASLTTNSDPVQTDTRMANKIYIWLFQNGAANAGINTGGQTAIQIMSDSSTGGGIPANERWNGPIYTTGGESVKLEDMAFAIIRVEYNPDAGTTGLDTVQIKVTNNMGASNGARPGTVILDYLQNDRYGCAIPLEYIDTTSLTNLDTYSNQTISYIDTSGNPQTQPFRYRINGAVNTAASCLQNLQTMVDSCDSWLQYSEATGKWKVVINGPFSGSESNLFLVDSNNLIGGVQINPVDLNETYNQVEVAYPNKNIKDQTDYQVIDLTNPANWSTQVYDDILSPNEAVNRLNISLPLVNEAVQAKYLAARRLLQSREDLVISCDLDYSGIQIEAGDVIRVGQPDYGWGPTVANPSNPYKLFRVSTVNEQTTEDGSLVASIEAFEYNGTVYADNAITDFVPADNTGLTDPNIISPPCPPTITNFSDANGLITGFTVQSCVPEEGTVMYMDFNYGTTNTVTSHQLYRTVQSAGGNPFVNSPDIANGNVTTVNITVNDLPAANYYWSATARNDTAGRYSNGSNVIVWAGANIQPYNPISNTGGISGGQVKANTISGNNIQSNTITFNNMSPGLTLGQYLDQYDYTVAAPVANVVNPPIDLTSMGANANIEALVGNNFFIQPKYLNGTTVGANYYYPYYQGTSTTANGYQANSTSSLYPANATQFFDQTGVGDWWPYEFVLFTPISPSEYLDIEWRGQFVSNADTTIQISRCIKFTSSDNDFSFQTDDHLHTIELKANLPQYIYFYATASGSGSVDGAGMAIRNMEGNTNVAILSGRLQVAKTK